MMCAAPRSEATVPVEEPNVSSKADPNEGRDSSVRECSVRLGQLDFTPGLELRRFVAVPEGATWGELRLRAGSYETPKCVCKRRNTFMLAQIFASLSHEPVCEVTVMQVWHAGVTS